MKYRKKPVVIDAFEWDETTETLDLLLSNGLRDYLFDTYNWSPDIHNFRITTLEGVMSAAKYDYIIKGISGEFYPCKPDIFKLTYEEVKE